MDYLLQSPVQLSSHLRALRKSRGMSQAQLGAVLGVGQTRITRIERDPAAISVEQLLSLLHALNVQIVLRPSAPRLAATEKPSASASHRSSAGPADEPW